MAKGVAFEVASNSTRAVEIAADLSIAAAAGNPKAIAATFRKDFSWRNRNLWLKNQILTVIPFDVANSTVTKTSIA